MPKDKEVEKAPAEPNWREEYAKIANEYSALAYEFQKLSYIQRALLHYGMSAERKE